MNEPERITFSEWRDHNIKIGDVFRINDAYIHKLEKRLAAAEARIAHAEGIIKHYSTTVPGNPYVGQIAKIYMDKMRENGYE